MILNKIPITATKKNRATIMSEKSPTFPSGKPLVTMKIVTIITFIILLTSVWGQQGERQKISGTNLTIILPEGAAIANHAPIVNFDNIADLNFLEFAADAANSMQNQNLDSAGLANQGATVLGTDKIQIDNSDAKIFFMRKDYELNGFACYFGDSTYAVVCNSIYPKMNQTLKNKIINALKTIQHNSDDSIDWDKYLSFTYDTNSVIKVCKYSTPSSSIRFSPNGNYTQNIYDKTTAMCSQFPPSENISNSEDLTLQSLVPVISQFELVEVKKDEKVNLKNKDEYHFNAICKRGDLVFELYFIAYYNPFSCVTTTAFIIDNEYEREVIDFIKSFKLKDEGY